MVGGGRLSALRHLQHYVAAPLDVVQFAIADGGDLATVQLIADAHFFVPPIAEAHQCAPTGSRAIDPYQINLAQVQHVLLGRLLGD